MKPNAVKPITVAEARAIDVDAVERLGMPSVLLMENAARAVADQVRLMSSRSQEVILCGPGNNGGDGLAAARHLGLGAEVYVLAEPDPARCPDAALQLRILRAAGWSVTVGVPPDLRGRSEDTVWVDALFGTGLTRPLLGEAARWVEVFEAARGPKLCVDIPSGLHGDTGQPLGQACCRGDVTVTFAAPKLGLLAPAAREFVGQLVVAPLGIPEPLPPSSAESE